MAVIETHTTNTSAPGLLSLSSAIATVVAWNERRLTRKILSKLSTRELDDIGLSRSDIDML